MDIVQQIKVITYSWVQVVWFFYFIRNVLNLTEQVVSLAVVLEMIQILLGCLWVIQFEAMGFGSHDEWRCVPKDPGLRDI